VGTPRHERGTKEIITMNILIAIIAIIAVIMLFTGGFVQSLNFLLWIGIVLAVIAVIVWLVRYLSGRRTSV
jgi:drug/metabolite transporter (DMT)-like permease